MTNTTRKGFLKSLAALLPAAILATPQKGVAQTGGLLGPTFTFAPGWQGTAKVTQLGPGRARLQVSALGEPGALPTVGKSSLVPRNFFHGFVGVGGSEPHAAFLDGQGDLRFWRPAPFGQFYCDVEFDF